MLNQLQTKAVFFALLLCSTHVHAVRPSYQDAGSAGGVEVHTHNRSTFVSNEDMHEQKHSLSLASLTSGGEEFSHALVKSDVQGEDQNEFPLTVPASSLVRIGRTKKIATTLKKIMESSLYQVGMAINTAIGAAGDWTALGVGAVLMAGTSIATKGIIDFISWGGVASAGISAADALMGIATAEHSCDYVVNGMKFVIAAGSLGLGIASLTCMYGTDGGTFAAFAAGAGDTLWMAMQPAFDAWCDGKKDASKLNAVVQVDEVPAAGGKRGITTEGDVLELAEEMTGIKDCEKPMSPAEADAKYHPALNSKSGEGKGLSFSQLLAKGEENAMACDMGELFSFPHAMCGSAWSLAQVNETVGSIKVEK